MAGEKLPDSIMERAEDQEVLISPLDRLRKEKYGDYSYKPEFAQIVYDLLSQSVTAKTKSHCCYALQCSKSTFLDWLRKYPEFNAAFQSGMEIGKMRWRDRIAEHAFCPTAQVNNGLIKLLSNNVYGIKDEPQTVVQVNNSSAGDMKITNNMSEKEAASAYADLIKNSDEEE